MDNLLKKHLETIIFILFLVLILILIIYFKIYDIIGIQSIITLFAVFVALGTGILTSFYNKNVLKQANELNEKALNHAKELNENALLQSEKNLRIQLLFEESMKSLYELKKFLETDFNIEKLKKFMESYHAIYLPNNTKETLNKLINEIDEFEKTNPYYIDYEKEYSEMKLSPKEERALAAELESEEQFYKNNPHIKFEMEYEQKSNSIKNRLMANVLENLKKDPRDYD